MPYSIKANQQYDKGLDTVSIDGNEVTLRYTQGSEEAPNKKNLLRGAINAMRMNPRLLGVTLVENTEANIIQLRGEPQTVLEFLKGNVISSNLVEFMYSDDDFPIPIVRDQRQPSTVNQTTVHSNNSRVHEHKTPTPKDTSEELLDQLLTTVQQLPPDQQTTFKQQMTDAISQIGSPKPTASQK